MSTSVFVGLDMGSSRSKVAVIAPDGALLGHAVRRSGTNFGQTAKVCLDEALDMAGARFADIALAVSTGYGRANVGFVTDLSKTEIGVSPRVAISTFPRPSPSSTSVARTTRSSRSTRQAGVTASR